MIFILPVIAKPEHLTLGPYNVTFDAGKELQDWNITKKESETYMGSPEVDYSAMSSGIGIFIHYLHDLKEGWRLDSIDEWRKTIDEVIKAGGGTCKSYPRVIDGRDGFVALAITKDGSFYGAYWYLTSNSSVGVISFYPWDEGTLQLLKTINITAAG